MNDVIVIACGGGAYRVLAESPLCLKVPVYNIKSSPVDDSSDHDRTLVVRQGDDNIQEVEAMLHGVRVVFILSMLGGSTATEVPKTIIDCARSHGCKVVQILGLPMKFEKDHRSNAEESMRELAGLSDATFLVDTESVKAFDDDNGFRMLLEYHDYTLTYATRALTDYAKGPFFSTFPRKVYTIAYASGMVVDDMVSRAMRSMMFPTELDNGMMVVMVGKDAEPARLDDLKDAVISIAGILPDIVRRDDDEGSKILIFIPIGV